MKLTLKERKVKIEYLATGDTFLCESTPYMRIGHKDCGKLKVITLNSEEITTFGIWAIDLTNGKLKKFADDTIVSYTNFELKEI